MRFVNRSPEARQDLVEIGLYIARDNPSASTKFLSNIEEKLKLLAKHVYPDLPHLPSRDTLQW